MVGFGGVVSFSKVDTSRVGLGFLVGALVGDLVGGWVVAVEAFGGATVVVAEGGGALVLAAGVVLCNSLVVLARGVVPPPMNRATSCLKLLISHDDIYKILFTSRMVNSNVITYGSCFCRIGRAWKCSDSCRGLES